MSLSQSEIKAFQESFHKRIEQYLPKDVPSLIIDKNPGLSCSLSAMHRLLPDSAWLMTLRDPRDIALSCYFQRFGNTPLGWASNTLEGAFEAVCHVLSFWLDVRKNLGPEQYIELHYETLVSKTDETIANICERLGWETNSNEGLSKSQESDLNFTPSYADIQSPVYQRSVARWKQCAEGMLELRDEQLELIQLLGYQV